jgi:hypothetical protein
VPPVHPVAPDRTRSRTGRTALCLMRAETDRGAVRFPAVDRRGLPDRRRYPAVAVDGGWHLVEGNTDAGDPAPWQNSAFTFAIQSVGRTIA